MTNLFQKFMRKKVIATSWHPGGVNAILPVIKRLNRESKLDIVTISHEYSEEIFQEADIKHKTINNYGLSDVSLESIYKLLKIESPDLILTGTSIQDKNNRDVIEQTITLAATEIGINSISVLDFWANYDGRFSDIYTNKKFRFLPSKIAIMDTLAENAMIKEGFPKERLVITGNPFFDDIIELKNNFTEEDKQRVKNDLNISLDSYLFLFASQPSESFYGNSLGYTEKTVLRELLDAITFIPNVDRDVSVLVKVHPREKKEDLENIVKGYKYFQIIVDQSYPTRETILASDAIISSTSTVLIESSYLEKPSISLQPGLKVEDMLITNELEVTLPIYKHGEVNLILEKLLFDKNYEKELSHKAKAKGFSIDGKATERVTELVYEMLNLN